MIIFKLWTLCLFRVGVRAVVVVVSGVFFKQPRLAISYPSYLVIGQKEWKTFSADSVGVGVLGIGIGDIFGIVVSWGRRKSGIRKKKKWKMKRS